MQVSELMQTEVETVSIETPVNDAFVTLAEARVTALPVVDGTGSLVGVISRTDILASEEDKQDEVAREALFQDVTVRDLMTSPALTIAPEVSVREAAQQMLSAGVHHLFVTRGDQIVGVISTTDLVRAVATGQL